MPCEYKYNGEWYTEEQLFEIFQKSSKTLPSRASEKTLTRVKDFLKQIGVDLQVTPYVTLYGKKADINGVSRLLEKVIEITEGKENVALVEEAMHFATYIIQQTNPTLYNQMLNRIGKYNIYQSVLEEYGNDPTYLIDGKPNIPKIKFEAIGKLLSEYYIKSEEGTTEKPELLEQRNSWIEKIINWFKSLITKAGFNPFEEAVSTISNLKPIGSSDAKKLSEKIISSLAKNNTYYPAIKDAYDQNNYSELIRFVGDQLSDSKSFIAAVDQLFSGNIDLAEEVRTAYRSYNFLQKSSEDLINKLDKTSSEVINKPTQDGDNAYFIGDKQVKNRVTRWIKKIMGDKFRNRKIPESIKNMEDQMKEWGSRGHRDMERLFKKYLTSDGKVVTSEGKLVVQNNEPFISELDPSQIGLADVLEDYVVDLLLSYPEGTVFRTEQTIYSSRGGAIGERDIAGTMDFVAILPNGKKDILDWKFIRVNTDKYSDIAWFKQNEWNLQMLEYKKILKRDYGLKDTDFGKTRMIPFVLTYTGKTVDESPTQWVPIDIETAGVNIKIDEKTYLLPVATPDESTGNQKLDKLITSLTSLYNTIKDLPASDNRRDIRNEQLQKLFTSIRHLQVTRNLNPLSEEISILVKDTERLIVSHNEKFKNPENLTEKEISDHAAELLLKAQALQTLKDVHITFRDFYGENPTEQELEILKNIKEMSDKVGTTFADIKDTIDQFTEKYIASRRGIDNLLSPEKTVTGLTKLFGTTSQLPTNALKTLFLMIDNANNQIQFELQDVKDELVKLKKDVDSSIGMKKLIELVKKKDKNELIDKYSKQFYSDIETAFNGGNIEWIKENIDLEAFKKDLERRKVEEAALIEDTIYFADEEKNNEEKFKRLKRLALVTDINSKEAFLDQNQLYHLKKFPSDDWISPEFEELEKNEAALKFYNFILKINKKAREIGYISGAKSEKKFLPYLYKSFSETVSLGGKYSFSDWVVGNLTIDENIAGYGNFDPLTKQAKNTIPVYFTEKIDDNEQISEDLFLNMAAYARSVINYEYKTQIDGQIRTLHFVEQNKQSLQVNKFGNLAKINGQPVTIDTNDANAQLLLSHMQSLQYGQKYAGSADTLLGDWTKGYNSFASKANNILGFKAIPEISKNNEDKQVSLNRLMDMINRFFTIKNMGLNVATSASVFAGGNFQAIINSGKYYKKREFLAGEWQHASHKVIKSEDIHLQLMKTFMPVDEELNREINKLAAGKLTGNSFSDFMMVLMRNADHTVQYANFLAFMKNTIVVDGKLYNAREYYRKTDDYKNRYSLPESQRLEKERNFENEVQKLLSEKGIEKLVSLDENGKVKIEGIPNLRNDNVLKYRTLISTVGRKATGNISPENEMLIRMNSVTRSMMVFKNWIPGMIKQRFGGLNEDVATGDWEYGRLRVIMKHLGPLALLKIKNINDIIKGTDKGVELLKEFYKRQKADYEEANNKELDLTEEEFMDLFRQCLENQLKELTILLTLIGMVTAVLPLFKPKDDDEEELKNKYKFASRMLDKIRDEVSFYYDPRGMQQILNGSIFPALGIFTDAANVVTSISKEVYGIAAGDEELTEKTYPLKNLMKSLPISREMIYYIAMFDNDIAKELGIKLASQSRMK